MTEAKKCGARTRAGGECRRYALKGTNRCEFHGGKSPQAQRKAQERLAEQAARRVLADLGEPVEPVVDAVGALESLAGECVALTSILRQKVAALETIRYSSSQSFEQLRGEVSAYIAMLGRTESVLSKIVSLNLDARRVQLDEARVLLVVAALDAVLSHRDLALDPARQRRGRELLARRLGASPTVLVGLTQDSPNEASSPPRCLSSDTSDVRETSLAPPSLERNKL